MKKLDKLILRSFLGPFILTFLVVVFILLTQYMLKYFDEFVGKDLGVDVFAQLLGYFAINMTPVAFPLAVLLSSLMTFGNLGEHFELTAIKSSGISLTRALLPIFIFTFIITLVAFFSNNYIVPRANLKAYSLLYDIRQKKPSLDLREGAFYNGLPGFSIKVNKKFPDGVTLKDLIIYDHTKGMGNTDVIIADSGKMYTINNDAYLKLEMYKGNLYSQQTSSSSNYSYGVEPDQFVRNKFYRSVYIFSLSSFDLQRTDEQLFANNRLMKNVGQLNQDIDSMRTDVSDMMYNIFLNSNRFFIYHLQENREIPEEFQPKTQHPPTFLQENAAQASLQESQINIADSAMKQAIPVLPGRSAKARQRIIRTKTDTVKSDSVSKDSLSISQLDSIINTPDNKIKALSLAVGQARYIKNHLMAQTVKLNHLRREVRVYDIEKHKKYTQAAACLVMFLIGAPLGAIIKKGGLGVPVIVSILFFIIYYVASILGEKWGRENIIPPALGAWGANIILLPFGLVFLRQARNDARLFEADFYKVIYSKFKKRFNIKD
ncbi:hypothetical protein BH23BAC1_BH23BAC1_42810 [soil metagenome]